MTSSTPPPEPPSTAYLLQATDARLHAVLDRLAGLRMVFFAGLPATGKSLLVHQLAHLAHSRGQVIHLLQWDIARPVFERSPAGARYRPQNGQANPGMIPIVGAWARGAVANWHRQYAGAEHLLLAETPLIGRRFIELALPADDATEALLTSAACQWVLPVPTNDVRRHIEAERERRSAHPLHEQERQDASPKVLRAVWPEVLEMAAAAGISADPTSGTGTYDSEIYQLVYERLLEHRTLEVVSVDRVLPTESMSGYQYAVQCLPLIPTTEAADALIRTWEAHHPAD